MLPLDTVKLTETEMLAQVADSCSTYGDILDLRLQRNGEGFTAVVEMATALAAVRVRQDFGDSTYGHFVKIDLRAPAN